MWISVTFTIRRHLPILFFSSSFLKCSKPENRFSFVFQGNDIVHGRPFFNVHQKTKQKKTAILNSNGIVFWMFCCCFFFMLRKSRNQIWWRSPFWLNRETKKCADILWLLFGGKRGGAWCYLPFFFFSFSRNRHGTTHFRYRVNLS